jgi:CHAT domain-containing protein
VSILAEATDLTSTTWFRGATSGRAGFRRQSFRLLEGAAREARAVARRWRATYSDDPSRGVVFLGGKDATELRFKQAASGHRVLHLATHGFFLDDTDRVSGDGLRGIGALASTDAENPLVLSGLALAGANHRARAADDEEDGVLTAEEIAALDLSGTEWAVLSACDTGLGRIRPGEGVVGLRRAFRLAGVRTLIMTLWPVEDEEAAEWIEALYRARLDDGADTATAVAQATRTLIEERRRTGASTHPVFWGPYVASGDWR